MTHNLEKKLSNIRFLVKVFKGTCPSDNVFYFAIHLFAFRGSKIYSLIKKMRTQKLRLNLIIRKIDL